jgi:DNA-binding NarL/FixJ family response regulator
MNPDRSGDIAIIIADDHAMVRAGLQRIIEGDLGMRVTGQAGDGAGTLARLQDTRCDVLLLAATADPGGQHAQSPEDGARRAGRRR